MGEGVGEGAGFLQGVVPHLYVLPSQQEGRKQSKRESVKSKEVTNKI